MVLRFFMLACAFIFISCVTAERDNPNDPGSDNYRGYQIIDPPSSSMPSSSSFVAKSSGSGEAYSSSSMISSGSSSAAKSSSSAVVSSSSSTLGSSSSVPPSSSSFAQSSSSVAVSSSSSTPSSSYSVPPSSSSLAPSSSSVVVYSSSLIPSSSAIAPPSSSSVAKSSSSVAVSSSSSVPTQSNVVYGTPVTYEDETYQTVVIGTQTWFKRNLNYAVSGSKCGNGSKLSDANTETCDTYGRLYNWATAMDLPASCNSASCASQVDTKHRGICPIGWHIPSDADWNVLMKFINPSCSDNSLCAGAGTKLKTASGWNTGSGYKAGTDNYGFSALPGGQGGNSSFADVGNYGHWWTTSENGSNFAYSRVMDYSLEAANWDSRGKSTLLSVRCLQD